MNETTYASPFSWRYARAELRELFSEHERRKLWRAVWIALAESQLRSGLVSQAELDDLRAHGDDIDLAAALAIEREIGHDLMAEIRVFASQATVGGGKMHLGATSMDIEDTVEIYRMRLALAPDLRRRSTRCCAAFAAQIDAHADTVCMGYTHLQPAEPTTIGYRLAVYAQDCSSIAPRCASPSSSSPPKAFAARSARRRRTRGCWRAPAVARPTGSRRARRVRLERARRRDANLSAQTRLPAALAACAGLGASLSKFAADVRILGSARFRRSLRAVRRQASRQFGDAVQAQSGDVASASIRSRGCCRAMPTSRGRTRRRTISSARSTTAPTAARSCPKRCCAPTRSCRSRARS